METKKWHESRYITCSIMFIIGTLILKYTGIIGLSWGEMVLMWSIPVMLILPFMMGFIFGMFSKKGFTNKNGTFRKYDIVIDRGSEVRPQEPGVLKHDIVEGWFIIYLDGFEWKLSEFKNIERF